MRILFVLLCFSSSLFTLNAQHTNCGVTSEFWQQEMAKNKSQLEAAANLRTTTTTGIKYIPLTIHTVRRTNGYGGPSSDDMKMFYISLMKTNRALQDIGIQFYIDGNIDNIKNDDYIRPVRGSAEHMALLAIKNSNTANVWINEGWSNANSTGYGGTYGVELSTDLSYITVVHQFAHFLTLAHTYETAQGIEHVARTGAGSNCSTAGDGICDTEADPYGLTVANGQILGANHAQQNCVMTSGTKDLSGDLYSPPYKNIMSAYDKTCGFEFTPGQLNQMYLGYLAFHANYTPITGTGIVGASGVLKISSNGGYNFIYPLSAMPTGSIGTQTEISSDNGITWKVMDGIIDRFTNIHDVKKGKQYILRNRALNSISYSPVIYHTPQYSAPLNPITNDEVSTNTMEFIYIPSVSGINFTGASTSSVFYSIENPYPMVNLIRGGNYQTNINISTSNEFTVVVWVDENQDGDFDDTGELKYNHQSANPNETDLSFSLHISATCDTGLVRIRMRSFPYHSPIDPYANCRYSDINDLILNVVNGVQAPVYCSAVTANSCYGTGPTTSPYGVGSFSISSVGFTNTSTGCGITSDGYSDYSAKTINLVAGQTYSFNETNGVTQKQANYLSIYLDANANFFFDSDELMYSHGPKSGVADPVTGSFTIPANAINGSARLRIRAYDDVIHDACSRVFFGETEDYTVVITGGKEPNVKRINITNITVNSMLLNWQANSSSTPSGYLINISTDGQHFTPLATVDAMATNYSVTGLQSGIRYYYQLISTGNINSNPAVAYGTTLGVATNAANVNITNITGNSIVINWQAVGTIPPSGYTINISTDGEHFSLLAIVDASATSYQATGLQSGARYYFQLIATGSISDPVIINGTTSGIATDILQTDLTGNDVKIFPNPVQHELYLVGSIITQNSIIGIQNIIGQNLDIPSIWNTNGFVLNTNILSKGIYFITIINGDNKQVVRFIKE